MQKLATKKTGKAAVAAATRKFPAAGFLEPVIRLEKQGYIDTALDALYDRVDEKLKAKKFVEINAVLEQADTSSLSVDVILGLLTASLPARSKLAARTKFATKAEASIRHRGAWEEGLLTGLV